jgi:hypothetical protein
MLKIKLQIGNQSYKYIHLMKFLLIPLYNFRDILIQEYGLKVRQSIMLTDYIRDNY